MIEKCIFILSCWRSGTSWLEDLLGKRVSESALFGHEQQILPLLSMMRDCYSNKNVGKVKSLANTPIDDIENFHEHMGFKFHKVLHNLNKRTDEPFAHFAKRFIDFLLVPYQNYVQVVEKSPENLSPDVFNSTLDIFGNDNFFTLVYLFRDFKPYLASCYEKFISKGKNTLEYYTDKWIAWHKNAVQKIHKHKPNNLFVLKYNDLVLNPEIIDLFCLKRKDDDKIVVRKGVLDKWKNCSIIKEIEKIYEEKIFIIKFIESEIERFKL
jgi:hypothetical protein